MDWRKMAEMEEEDDVGLVSTLANDDSTSARTAQPRERARNAGVSPVYPPYKGCSNIPSLRKPSYTRAHVSAPRRMKNRSVRLAVEWPRTDPATAAAATVVLSFGARVASILDGTDDWLAVISASMGDLVYVARQLRS